MRAAKLDLPVPPIPVSKIPAVLRLAKAFNASLVCLRLPTKVSRLATGTTFFFLSNNSWHGLPRLLGLLGF